MQVIAIIVYTIVFECITIIKDLISCNRSINY